MIRSLRRRHRWMMSAIFAALAIAAAMALAHPAPSPRVERLPEALANQPIERLR